MGITPNVMTVRQDKGGEKGGGTYIRGTMYYVVTYFLVALSANTQT